MAVQTVGKTTRILCPPHLTYGKPDTYVPLTRRTLTPQFLGHCIWTFVANLFGPLFGHLFVIFLKKVYMFRKTGAKRLNTRGVPGAPPLGP